MTMHAGGLKRAISPAGLRERSCARRPAAPAQTLRLAPRSRRGRRHPADAPRPRRRGAGALRTRTGASAGAGRAGLPGVHEPPQGQHLRTRDHVGHTRAAGLRTGAVPQRRRGQRRASRPRRAVGVDHDQQRPDSRQRRQRHDAVEVPARLRDTRLPSAPAAPEGATTETAAAETAADRSPASGRQAA